MTLLRMAFLACLLCLPIAGGCAQRVAVEGRSDQLYAEALGALESEGFRPVGRGSTLPGATGHCRAEGRLQFLYYADTIAPTVVEIRIEPGEMAAADVASANVASGNGAGSIGGSGSAAAAGSPGAAGSPAAAGKLAAAASSAAGTLAAFNGPHSVAISAWSSLTYAPDPWIADLAMGVVRRAYLLSGNIH